VTLTLTQYDLELELDFQKMYLNTKHKLSRQGSGFQKLGHEQERHLEAWRAEVIDMLYFYHTEKNKCKCNDSYCTAATEHTHRHNWTHHHATFTGGKNATYQ